MSHAEREIRSQADTWDATLAGVPAQWARIAPAVPIAADTHILIVGCGTSYYLAQTAAHIFQEATGRVARAVPGSEVFLSPGSTVPRAGLVVAFIVSRSGTTSEAVMAARHLATMSPRVVTVAVTCTPDSALARATDHAIELEHAAERSVVMTRSFTNLLLAMQVVAATVADDRSLLGELAGLPGVLRSGFDGMAAFGTELGRRGDLRRIIYLGLGPNYGLAEEATLKLKEMTQVECEPYNPLEFRHGAISTVIAGTAVVLLAGERERDYVADLEAELGRFGAYVATIAPYPSDHADASVLLPPGVSDLARGPLYLPAVQLLAHERALLLGLDPDAPRNLGAVVVLGGR